MGDSLLRLDRIQEPVNLVACQMTAEEGDGTGSNQRNDAIECITQKDEQREWRSWHQRRIHESAESELCGFGHGLYLVEDDDFARDACPICSQEFADALAHRFDRTFVAGIQIHGRCLRCDGRIYVPCERECHRCFAGSWRTVQYEMRGAVDAALNNIQQESLDGFLTCDVGEFRGTISFGPYGGRHSIFPYTVRGWFRLWDFHSRV